MSDEITLSESQEAACSTVDRALDKGAPLVIIDGPAGTGKTTVIAKLKHRLQDDFRPVIYAPTNAAARRLQIKGIPDAQTFYRGEFVGRSEYSKRFRELDDLLFAALQERPQNPDKIAAARAKRDALKEKRKLGFTHVSEFEDGFEQKRANSEAPIVICDETSMVTTDYIQQMSAEGRLIVLVGDEFQLPPVKGKNIYAEYEPTVHLTHVHRHGGKILDLAREIRLGDLTHLSEFKRKRVDEGKLGALIVEGQAMIIAWKNDTVDLWNDRIRERLGFKGDDPLVGERLISRSNAGALLNNEIVTVTNIDPFTVRNEFGLEHVIEDYEMVLSKPGESDAENIFSFGYCITAHRAQGNEWQHVLVVDQRQGMSRVMSERDKNRWIYTAITRAQTTLSLY